MASVDTNQERTRHRNKFFDVDFASLTVAFLALVASQFPPIHMVFAKPDLKINFADRIGVSHHLGLISLVIGTQITNDGSSSAIMQKAEMSLKAMDDHSFNKEFILDFVSTPSHSEVFRPVSFFPEFYLTGDLFYREKTDLSIIDQYQLILTKAEQEARTNGKLSPALITEISDMTARIDDFTARQYSLLISFSFRAERDFDINQCYSFYLLDSHVAAFRNETRTFITTAGKEQPDHIVSTPLTLQDDRFCQE